MIGAIIGDIAAWTYEHDRETFWNQLISYDEKVSLSEYVHAYMQAASKNLSDLSNRETYTLDITDYSPTDLLHRYGELFAFHATAHHSQTDAVYAHRAGQELVQFYTWYRSRERQT